jgi:hypothetical protein
MSESSKLSNDVFGNRLYRAFARRKRAKIPPQLNRTVRWHRPDDDPPPSPARAAIPVRHVLVTASSTRPTLAGIASCRLPAAC